MPSHYLNQCWVIVNRIFRNKLQWNFNQNTSFSFTKMHLKISSAKRWPGGCFTNVSWALQDIISKFVYCRNRTSYENFKLKLCTCAQSPVLGTRTKFQLKILTIYVISGMVYFRKIILESSRNISETTPSVLWFNINTLFPAIGIFIKNIRLLWHLLIFIGGIPIMLRQQLYIEMPTWSEITTYTNQIN